MARKGGNSETKPIHTPFAAPFEAPFEAPFRTPFHARFQERNKGLRGALPAPFVVVLFFALVGCSFFLPGGSRFCSGLARSVGRSKAKRLGRRGSTATQHFSLYYFVSQSLAGLASGENKRRSLGLERVVKKRRP